jgi:hypothetical protein
LSAEGASFHTVDPCNPFNRDDPTVEAGESPNGRGKSRCPTEKSEFADGETSRYGWVCNAVENLL